MTMKKFLALGLALMMMLSVAPLAANAQSKDEFNSNLTLYENLQTRPNFSTLVAALDATGLDAAVNDPNASLTLFAPSNRAFDRTLNELGLTLNDLLNNLPLLESILLYHVVPGVVPSSVVLTLDGSAATALNGDEIDINIRNNGRVMLNGNVRVNRVDAFAANGVIHRINRVLLPPSQGFNNGTTIFDLLEARPRFSTLVAALQATGLDTALDVPLNEAASLTLLAPTNAAFDRTLNDLGLTLNDLLNNLPLLESILLYHVIPAEAREADVRALAGSAAPTLNGATIAISIDGQNRIILNDVSRVKQTDKDAVNGLYHQINYVLIPPTP